MAFRIGGSTYHVRVTDGQLLSDDGRRCAGLFEWLKATIWISGELPPGRREETLFHELAHAWRHHFGRPADDEADANQLSAFVRTVVRQYRRQGGQRTLRRL